LEWLGVEFVELGIGSGLGRYWRVRGVKDLDLGLVTCRKIDECFFQVELGDKLMPSTRANSKDFGKRTVSSPDGTQHASRKITFAGVMPLENFLRKCSMGYNLYPWISLLEFTLETFYKPQT